MKTTNVKEAIGSLSTDPMAAESKKQRYLKNAEDALYSLKHFRLYHGDNPSGMLVVCHPMEAHAWNKNSRAFYAWQCELGRERLPLMEWLEEENKVDNPMYIIKYHENSQNKVAKVCGRSKADAKREFAITASLGSIVDSVEQCEDTPPLPTKKDTAYRNRDVI